MKKQILILLVVLGYSTLLCNAQTTMNIHMKGGKVTQVPLDQIEMIT